MNNIDIVMSYIRCFCAGDIDGMEHLLAPDIKFKGPLYTFSTSKSYIESLRGDPPENAEYNVQSITTSHDSVAVFYEYIKSKQVMPIAPLFHIEDKKINALVVVFDARLEKQCAR